MRLGILSKTDDVTREIWRRLSSIVRWQLLGRREHPDEVTLGDLRQARRALRANLAWDRLQRIARQEQEP